MFFNNKYYICINTRVQEEYDSVIAEHNNKQETQTWSLVSAASMYGSIGMESRFKFMWDGMRHSHPCSCSEVLQE